MMRDEELYRQYLSGDELGLRELMNRYGDRLTLYLRSFTDSLDEAEDLMVESFARVFLAKPSLRQDCFRAYLFKTGRRLAARAHHRRTRLPSFSLEQLEQDPESGQYLENTLLRDETRRTLHLCLERLDPSLRESLWLIYFEDMSYAEASEILGIRPKQRDYLLQKGKRLLREEMKKEGVTDARY